MAAEGTKVQARVSRNFSVSAERVFDAWLKTDLIGQFMFGPTVRDEEIVRLRVDARVGGSFSFVVRRQGQEIDHVGTYLEIERPTRLAFTWAIAGEGGEPSRVIIDIAPKGSGCELTLVHKMSAEWKDFVKRSEDAWGKMLSNLARILV